MAGTTTTTALGTVEDAEMCETLADYQGLRARIVIGNVLRAYLDAQVLLPSEVMYVNRHLKALTDQGPLANNAITRIAAAQARQPGQQQRARVQAMQAAFNEVQAKARVAQLAFADLPKNRGPIDAVLAAPARGITGDSDYDLRVALCLQLSDERTWSAKGERLIVWMQEMRDERLAGPLDGLMADFLCSGPVLNDLFGVNSTPATQVMGLCDMVLSRTSTGGQGLVAVLNGFFRQGRLPQAREAVLDRMRRMLRVPQPMGRTPQDEAEMVRALCAVLLSANGVVGGTGMAEALTQRYARRMEHGGAAAFRHALAGIAETLRDLFARIHYLAAVSHAPMADRHRREIADALEAALGNELLIEALITQSQDPDALRTAFDGAVAVLRGANLPTDLRERMARRLAGLVDDYASQGRLFAILRGSESVLRRRVIRLAELAVSGLVREDGGLPVLRQHILEIVKQPQFQDDLASVPNTDLGQAEVRRLYGLLDRLRQTGRGSGAGAARPAAAPASPSAPVPTPVPAQNPAPVLTGAGVESAAVSSVAVSSVALAEAETVVAPLAAGAGRLPLAAPPPGDRCPYCFTPRPAGDLCTACQFPRTNTNREGLHLPPGTDLFGRYRTGRLLGQGGFGMTYLGWDERLQVKVAIKEYYPGNLVCRVANGIDVVPYSDEHGRSFDAGRVKFLEEARTLARLREVPAIVDVQDFFEANGTAYIVMELLEGRTLKRYVAEQNGRLDVRRTLAVLTPIMRALQSVHDQGMIHRDISPDNIFITVKGDRKLLDFGAARQAAARQAAGEGGGLTVMLKPGYAPPEQYTPDGRQGPWTDVYALCATAYCTLTGKAPPDATSRFMDDRVPSFAAMGASVPVAVEKVIMNGISMRWQDRPQSMLELMKSLTAALNTGG
ncbi:hypothetical protein M2352_003962 [Azospirillum fermentarium]|uniref:serine/threonine protein kinase n=1 Tax=Azospirillum fermentarium TaxID=1233114 RepID=UPI002225C108|nr:serine/threonine-protein kinase [Azospirillum fermentarium]MCW2248328.1 hypothetical protein [Azospirillum fermentarium]